MGLQIDWYNQIINITSPTTDLSLQVAHDFIEDEMATPRGCTVGDIIQPEGKIEDPNQPGVYSQIIIVLNSPWQFQFWGGSGYTRIYGGKLVGGLSDEPFKATGTAGDITVLESPVDGVTVTVGSGLDAAQDAKLTNIDTRTEFADKTLKNKRGLLKEGSVWYAVVMDDDEVTPISKKALKDLTVSEVSDILPGAMCWEMPSSV